MTEPASQSPGAEDAMRREVWVSLNRPQPEISPKYFYDARGSELFDRITRLAEYYPTRTERALLEGFGRRWIARIGARALVELGAGSADKTRALLDALPPERTLYLPVDISSTYLAEVGSALMDEYPGLTVLPVESDISRELDIPRGLPEPTVVAFLGSTLGNFYPPAAVRLLRQVADALRTPDRLLLGVDLHKERAVLERAYNDDGGVTAEFNRNVLHVLNRELGADFDPDGFVHRAFYNEPCRRIEMHLVARGPQTATIPGCGAITLPDGATIRTEISTKYDRATIDEFFGAAGLDVEEWVEDERGWYALVVARRRAPA
jgi:L-histidine Nalpha-methyltransferase